MNTSNNLTCVSVCYVFIFCPASSLSCCQLRRPPSVHHQQNLYIFLPARCNYSRSVDGNEKNTCVFSSMKSQFKLLLPLIGELLLICLCLPLEIIRHMCNYKLLGIELLLVGQFVYLNILYLH